MSLLALSGAVGDNTSANTLPSQTIVPTSSRASPRFIQSIQGPGRGRKATSDGRAATRSQGAARPSPSARKIPKRSAIPPDSAAATAVPTNGAEQGVARIVASMPARKSPRYDTACGSPAMPASAWAKRGTGMTTRSRRLTAKNPSITIMTARNSGFWNWTPQPTVPPASRSIASPPASSMKLDTMPAAPARKRSRNWRRGAPTADNTDDSFSASTGRTQGIRLRISPPRSARSIILTDRPAAMDGDPAEPLAAATATANSPNSGGALTVSVRRWPAISSPSEGTAAMNSPSPCGSGALKATFGMPSTNSSATAGAPRPSST